MDADREMAVHVHMRDLGLAALAHANWHASHLSFENAYWSELSVLQAAHACELLIKARIAEEHPLLIFEHLPKASAGEEPLSLQQLAETGRTFQYADLPDRLWACTKMRLTNVDRYRAFGKLRNAIQHFTSPAGVDVRAETFAFIYGVIDPFIHTCWNLYAVDYDQDNLEPYTDLVDSLIRHEVRFLVPREAATIVEAALPSLSEDGSYRSYMQSQLNSLRIAPSG